MFDRLHLGIYWDKFWPLVDGCTPAGPECDRCWRARYQHRFDKYLFDKSEALYYFTTHDGKFKGEIQTRPSKLHQPIQVKKPTVWFVLNDLYHEQVKASFITRAYEVMEACPQHIFIVCTKRPERIDPVLYGEEGHFYMGGGDYLPNVWHMTTAGNQEMADKRIPELIRLGLASPGWPVLGVSIEPMLGPVDIRKGLPPTGIERAWAMECGSQSAINWVVLGGESGPGARPMNPDWVRSVRNQCLSAGVSFFFKQWGEWYPIEGGMTAGSKFKHYCWNPGASIHDLIVSSRVGKKAAGRLLDGRTWDELPKIKEEKTK